MIETKIERFSTHDDSSSSSSFCGLSPQKVTQRKTNQTPTRKLSFDALRLHGREKELSAMNKCFDHLLTGNLERQLILISGDSGTGKSRLANALRKPTNSCNGLFVRGKFDVRSRNEPYSGFVNACAEICGALLELRAENPAYFALICKQIKTELGAELNMVIEIIPVLGRLLESETSSSINVTEVLEQPEIGANTDCTSTLTSSSADAKNSFHFAFVRFMRILSSEFEPLVVVIDDLQWSDASSLELLELLVADRGNPKLLVMGTYRSNEVDSTHIFNQTLNDLRMKSRYEDFRLTEVKIGNLELEAVHAIIQNLLGANERSPQTLGLAEICLNKTLGNAFFLIQYLSMLYEKKLIRFGVSTYAWTWDLEEIRASTLASDNVVDLLKARMTTLQKPLIETLKIAALMGARFELNTFILVWSKMTAGVPEGRHDDVITARLENLENEGLILKVSKNVTPTYIWAHDKIQEAAISLLNVSEQAYLGRRIGTILVSEIDHNNESDSALVFVAVNLLNSGSENLALGKEARIQLAKWNCVAGRKAVSSCAFESAALFAGKGVLFLPDNSWKDNYELALGLYSIGARAEGSLGNVETLERYCREVLSQDDRPIEDKFEVYNAWIDSISNRGFSEAGIDVLLDISEKFNCRFPTKPFAISYEIVINVMQIKATMSSRDVSTLCKMEDKSRIELMKLLDKLATCLYMVGDDRMPLAIFCSLNWSMKYGYCDYSSVAFATTGMMLTGTLNDLQGGAKYGERALVLLGKTKSSITASRTMFWVYSYLFSWTKPYKELLKPLLKAYDVGLQSGDTESASWSVFIWLQVKLLMGSSLETVEPAVSMYSKQMKALKRIPAFYALRLMWQTLKHLMGHSISYNENDAYDPTSFTGDVISEGDLEYCRTTSPFLRTIAHSFESILMALFGAHKQNADLTIKLGHDYLAKVQIASPIIVRDTCLKGVSCFAAAREMGKKKYAKMGNVLRAKMHKWAKMGNPNIKHLVSLLDAEAMALKNTKISSAKFVIEQFEVAIAQAVRGGYKHDAALACERLGEYHLAVFPTNDGRYRAQARFEQAIKYWRNWGAIGKVYQLETKYSILGIEASVAPPSKELKPQSRSTFPSRRDSQSTDVPGSDVGDDVAQEREALVVI